MYENGPRGRSEIGSKERPVCALMEVNGQGRRSDDIVSKARPISGIGVSGRFIAGSCNDYELEIVSRVPVGCENSAAVIEKMEMNAEEKVEEKRSNGRDLSRWDNRWVSFFLKPIKEIR